MKEIPLTRGKVAIVDDDMHEYLMQWKWHISHNGYAVRTSSRVFGKQKRIPMHRAIMNPPDGMLVDHINSNRKLDNRRENLRICTRAQNVCNTKLSKKNTSGFKGVNWHKRAKKWQAMVQKNNKNFFAGYFDDPEDAAHAYDEKARELHGEFASTNFK